MGYFIIILLIIIILILVAPVVLGIFGLFIAAVIAAIITYWWVFLIAIVLALALPSILKISLNSVDNNRKLTKKKKYIILSSSAILLLAIVFGILVNNKTILIYPIECEYEYSSDLTKRAKEKLFNDRGDKINDIIPFGKFRFGMTKKELLDHVRRNRISTEIFFDNFTYSKIRISDSIIELPIKYYFDTKNKLRVVEFELDTSLIQRTTSVPLKIGTLLKVK